MTSYIASQSRFGLKPGTFSTLCYSYFDFKYVANCPATFASYTKNMYECGPTFFVSVETGYMYLFLGNWIALFVIVGQL